MLLAPRMQRLAVPVRHGGALGCRHALPVMRPRAATPLRCVGGSSFDPSLLDHLARHGVKSPSAKTWLGELGVATLSDLTYLEKKNIEEMEDELSVVELNRLRTAVKAARQLNGGDGRAPWASATAAAAAASLAQAAAPAMQKAPADTKAAAVLSSHGVAPAATVAASLNDLWATPSTPAAPPAAESTWFDDNLGTSLRIIDAGGPAWAIAFSPCGGYLAVGLQSGLVRIWNAYTGEMEAELEHAHSGEITSVAWSPDARTLATTSHDCNLHLLHVPEKMVRGAGQPADKGRLYHLPSIQGDGNDNRNNHPAEFHEQYGAAFSPDGRILVGVSDDAYIRVWDRVRGVWVPTSANYGECAYLSVALAQRVDPKFPDGGRLLGAVGLCDGGVTVWDLSEALELRRTGKCAGKVLHDMEEGGEGQTYSVSMSADGGLLASSCEDGTISLYDLNKLLSEGETTPMCTLATSDSSVYSVALTPCGRGALSASQDGAVMLWDVGRRGVKRTLRSACNTAALAVAIAPNGRLAAAVDEEGMLQLWVLKK